MSSARTTVSGAKTVALFLLGLNCFGQMQLWKYVQPDPPSITVLEWRRVLDSPHREIFRREIPPATLQLLSRVNFIEGIERAVVTGSGDGELILLGGNFDPAAMREAAVADGGIVKMYREAQILQPADPEQAETTIALIGKNVVLLGKREVILAALDASQLTKIQPRGGGYDLWIASKASEFAMVHLRDGGIRLDSVLHTASAAMAENATRNARALDLTAVQNGSDVRLTGSFQPDVFSNRLGLWRTSIEQLTVAEAKPAQEEVPKGPMKVKIYGLDSAPKEVTFPQGPPK